MFKNKIYLTIILTIILLSFSVSGFAIDYRYTQESGVGFFVSGSDKSDAIEDTCEIRQIVNDLGTLLVHSKMDGTYPKDLTTGGTIQIPEAGLKFSNAPANNDIAAYIAGEMTWQTKAELGIQPLDTALTNISALTYVSPSFIKLTANDTYAVRTLAETKTDLSLNYVENLKVKLDGTAAPAAATDDITLGYTVGSRWFDITNDKEYVCLDNTDGAAVWTETTGAGGGATTFVALTDTPANYTGSAGLFAKVNAGETALEFAAESGGVDTSGTPVDNDFAKFTDADTVEGRSYSETMEDLNPITTKTAIATLTIAEAGTVLVSCAATPYTLTLPTASGHGGLTYHFIKTDANYFLITLDGDGAETFNYENSTGTPNTTYPRLNTYCAEVTIVSDGTNWQVIDEAMGQIPMCRAYLGTQQNYTIDSTWVPVDLDTETFDIGGNFDVGNWVSGNATSTSAGHLVDSGGAFTDAMLYKRVKNTTDTTYTYITAVSSATDVTVRDDIFVDTEGYEIKASKFVCPVAGKYEIKYSVGFTAVVADVRYFASNYINTTADSNLCFHSSHNLNLYLAGSSLSSCSIDDEITLRGLNISGGDLTCFVADSRQTWISVQLISKD